MTTQSYFSEATFLMSHPKYFGCNYVINPWMEGNIGKVDNQRAQEQWVSLVGVLLSLGSKVEVIPGRKNLPDLVFTANAGLLLDDLCVVSSFKNEERIPEAKVFKHYFKKLGYVLKDVDKKHIFNDFTFEGAGDCLVDSNGEYWIAYGFRTNFKSAFAVTSGLNSYNFHYIKLSNPSYYHLDTCFCPLSRGFALYYPKAMTEDSVLEIKSYFNNGAIEVSDEDAANFACNAVCINDTIVVNKMSDQLIMKLRSFGFSVIQTPMTEFMKAGGSVKCLTLRLTK